MSHVKQSVNLPQIISAFRNGATASRICIAFGLSERRYYELLKRHSEQFDAAKKKRLMNQKKKIKSIQQRHKGPTVDGAIPKKKISSDEKVAHLEKRLELERKKNEQLEELLKIAKEHLGKF